MLKFQPSGLLTVSEGQPLGCVTGHAEQSQRAAGSCVGHVLCREAWVKDTGVTLKEVLLVFGGYVGLLIYSLQKDRNPRHVREGRCQEAPWRRAQLF